MPYFIVTAQDVSYKIYRVEADSAEEAEEKVLDGEHEGFTYGDGGDWEVVGVEQEA